MAPGWLSLREIAATAGVSPSTVLRDLRKGNPDPDDGTVVVHPVRGRDGKIRPSRRYDTTERDETIRRLRADGRSILEIAQQVTCSVGTVHRVLNLPDLSPPVSRG